MKKIVGLFALVMVIGTAAASAQDKPGKTKTETKTHKTKVKPTSTTTEKLHNAVSNDNKYSGVKVKGKDKKTNRKTKVEIHKT